MGYISFNRMYCNLFPLLANEGSSTDSTEHFVIIRYWYTHMWQHNCLFVLVWLILRGGRSTKIFHVMCVQDQGSITTIRTTMGSMPLRRQYQNINCTQNVSGLFIWQTCLHICDLMNLLQQASGFSHAHMFKQTLSLNWGGCVTSPEHQLQGLPNIIHLSNFNDLLGKQHQLASTTHFIWHHSAEDYNDYTK